MAPTWVTTALAGFFLLGLLLSSYAQAYDLSQVLPESTLRVNDVSLATRALWMRQANKAVKDVTGTKCPFAAFGTAIVNHTETEPGTLVCTGGNMNSLTGNPSLHGKKQLEPSMQSVSDIRQVKSQRSQIVRPS